MKIQVYSDGASLVEMLEAYKNNKVSGFTTNPTLMKKAGVDNYLEFAKNVLEKINEPYHTIKVGKNTVKDILKLL